MQGWNREGGEGRELGRRHRRRGRRHRNNNDGAVAAALCPRNCAHNRSFLTTARLPDRLMEARLLCGSHGQYIEVAGACSVGLGDYLPSLTDRHPAAVVREEEEEQILGGRGRGRGRGRMQRWWMPGRISARQAAPNAGRPPHSVGGGTEGAYAGGPGRLDDKQLAGKNHPNTTKTYPRRRRLRRGTLSSPSLSRRCAPLAHRKFAVSFVDRGGVRALLSIPGVLSVSFCKVYWACRR